MTNRTKTAALIVGLVAITLGSIANFAPHLFFKVPKIGFLLFAITGGSPIPPFITQEPFEKNNHQTWLKNNDVIVSTGTKSGTTWMLYCSHQIRVKGDDEKYPFGDVSLATPWPGLIQTPGDNWDIQREKLNSTILSDGTRLKDYWDHEDYPFRIFKSHDTPEAYGDLIGDHDSTSTSTTSVKFLAMSRNGLDMVASMVPFFPNHSDKFRKMWGNFPPPAAGTMQQEASIRIQQLMPGGMLYHMYFEYVNAWWKARNEKNVLLLHYSDAKRDLSGTVKRIAKFYGVELNAKEHKAVVHKCGFSHMKQNTDMFNYKLPLNYGYGDSSIMNSGSLTRKGINGDGKATFTDEEQEKWTKAEEEEFGDDPEKLKWARGGEGEDGISIKSKK